MTPTTHEWEIGIHEHIATVDEKHSEAHDRHRKLIEALGERLQRSEDLLATVVTEQATNRILMQGLERRKVEINNVRFTPSMVVSMLALVASIIGGPMLATRGLAAKQQETANAIDLMKAQLESSKQHEEDMTRLQDERAANIQRQVLSLTAQTTMIDTKINNLRETLAGRK